METMKRSVRLRNDKGRVVAKKAAHPKHKVKNYSQPRVRGLTLKQMRFVDEYMVDSNATAAARRAGYAAHSPGAGLQLLHLHPQITEEVMRRRAKLSEELKVTAERVVLELARIAFADPRRLATWDKDEVLLTSSKELSDDDARCISEVSSAPGRYGTIVRFKTHDKKGALDSLARHLGLFNGDNEEERKRLLGLLAQQTKGLTDETADDIRHKILGLKKVGA
jgi:phage terminase small subunit